MSREQAEEKIVADVAEYGWHVMNVFAEEGRPGFSYSIGLSVTFRHPEIILFGLRSETAHQLINLVGNAVQEGKSFEDGSVSSDFLSGYDCVFLSVPRRFYEDYLGFGLWFYGEESFPVLQLVYPDRNGHWPWEPEAGEGFRQAQPVLADGVLPS